MYLIFGIILLSTIAAVAVFRRSRWAWLRQSWLEMGLLLLAAVAMAASMLVPPASGSEKSLVYLSIYSGAFLIVAGTIHMATIAFRRTN